MRIESKEVYKRVLFLGFALCVLLSASPYFQWDSYDKPMLSKLLRYMNYAGLLLMVLYIMMTVFRNKMVEQRLVLISFFLVMTLIEMNVFGATYTSYYRMSSILAFTTFLICYSLRLEDRSCVYELMMKSFVILTAPSLVYYIFTRLFGVSIPFIVLQSDNLSKAGRGIYYELRPLGLIVRGTSSNILSRICGIYDEPGVIGTTAAFFTSVNLFSKKNRVWTVLLVIEGIMSFSMAFYLLFFITILMLMLNKGAFKFFFVILASVLALQTFLNLKSDNEVIRNIQNRIDVSSAFMITDNRTSETFDQLFEDFLEEGGYPVLMGHGYDASYNNPRNGGTSSYKRVIYDYGFVGSILFFGFFVLVYVWGYGIDKYSLPFFAVFAISWYQRPYVLNEMYIALYVTAFAYLSINKDESFFSRKARIKVA